jgi:hypothetical protein
MPWILIDARTEPPLPNSPQQSVRSASRKEDASPAEKKDTMPPTALRRKPGDSLDLLEDALEQSRKGLMMKVHLPLHVSELNAPPKILLNQGHPPGLLNPPQTMNPPLTIASLQPAPGSAISSPNSQQTSALKSPPSWTRIFRQSGLSCVAPD